MKTIFSRKHEIILLLSVTLGLLYCDSFAQSDVYWGTYLKGKNPNITFDSQDMAEAMAVDSNGDVYIVGRTNSVQAKSDGTFKHSTDSSGVAYLAKLGKCGDLRWVSYLGNDNAPNCTTSISCTIDQTLVGHGCSEWAYCLTLDHSGDTTFVYVGGEIMQGGSGTPVLVAGVSPYTAATSTSKDRWDGFVAKFNSSGIILNWTYLSGNATSCENTNGQTIDEVLGIVVDGDHHVFATGYTESSNLGVTDAGTVTSNYQSYTSGTNGGDCFIARFDRNLRTLENLEFIGNTGNDRAHSIVISDDDTYGTCLVIGATTESSSGIFLNNTNFAGITSNPYDNSLGGTQDAFVLKWKIDDYVAATPKGPYWITYVGGNGKERGRGIDVDASGIIYFTGWTASSTGLGTDSTSLYSTSFIGTGNDGFLGKIGTDGSLTWMTYFGGNKDDRPNSLRVFTSSGYNYIVVSGSTNSTNLGTVDCSLISCGAILKRDAFIVKFKDCDPDAPGYCMTRRQSIILQTYLGGAHDEFDLPNPPAGQGTADGIFNSYGPSMNLRPSDNTIHFAFSTKSTRSEIISGTQPNNWGRGTADVLQDTYGGDAFVGKIIPAGYSDGCTFPRLSSNPDILDEVLITPNPFDESFEISFESELETEGTVMLSNILGESILVKAIQVVKGDNSFNFELGQHASGIYLCNLYIGERIRTFKIVKE